MTSWLPAGTLLQPRNHCTRMVASISTINKTKNSNIRIVAGSSKQQDRPSTFDSFRQPTTARHCQQVDIDASDIKRTAYTYLHTISGQTGDGIRDDRYRRVRTMCVDSRDDIRRCSQHKCPPPSLLQYALHTLPLLVHSLRFLFNQRIAYSFLQISPH